MSSTLEELPDITSEGLENLETQITKQKDFNKKEDKPAFDVKNYLNTRLSDGQTKKEMSIRLLPIENNQPFKIVYMHTVAVPKEIASGGWKSYICLEKTEGIDSEKYGTKCPFCEMNREAYKKSLAAETKAEKDEYQRISLSNKAQLTYISKLIERGNESDGPKFWKFNDSPKKRDGIFDKIKRLKDTREKEAIEAGQELNFFSCKNGKDLVLIIEKSESNDSSKNAVQLVTSYQILDKGFCTPLSKDVEQAKKWLLDSKKWSDVFVPKTYDYLKLILDNKIPYFSKEMNKWISKDEYLDKKDEISHSNVAKNNSDEAKFLDNTNTNDSINEDLPF